MSLFAAATAIGAVAQDVIYGEAIRFEPQVNDDGAEMVSAGPDPDRPARDDLVGIYDDEDAIARPVGSGANTHETVSVSASEAQVDFDIAQFATEADRPVQGDRLVLIERPGPPRVQISSARPDNFGRLICLVVPVRSAP